MCVEFLMTHQGDQSIAVRRSHQRNIGNVSQVKNLEAWKLNHGHLFASIEISNYIIVGNCVIINLRCLKIPPILWNKCKACRGHPHQESGSYHHPVNYISAFCHEIVARESRAGFTDRTERSKALLQVNPYARNWHFNTESNEQSNAAPLLLNIINGQSMILAITANGKNFKSTHG